MKLKLIVLTIIALLLFAGYATLFRDKQYVPQLPQQTELADAVTVADTTGRQSRFTSPQEQPNAGKPLNVPTVEDALRDLTLGISPNSGMTFEQTIADLDIRSNSGNPSAKFELAELAQKCLPVRQNSNYNEQARALVEACSLLEKFGREEIAVLYEDAAIQGLESAILAVPSFPPREVQFNPGSFQSKAWEEVQVTRLEELAQTGNLDARYRLATLYSNGFLHHKDDDRAKIHLKYFLDHSPERDPRRAAASRIYGIL